MICPYCGSELLTYCDCCEKPWCPLCDRHVDLTNVKRCPKCGKLSYVQSDFDDWVCFECGYEGED